MNNKTDYTVSIFILFLQPETNIFANLSKDDVCLMKERMRELILSTDMKVHSSTSAAFQRVVEEGIDYNNPEHEKQVRCLNEC